MHELLSFNFQPVAVQTNQKHLRVVLGYCSLKCPGMLLYGVVALQDVSIPLDSYEYYWASTLASTLAPCLALQLAEGRSSMIGCEDHASTDLDKYPNWVILAKKNLASLLTTTVKYGFGRCTVEG